MGGLPIFFQVIILLPKYQHNDSRKYARIVIDLDLYGRIQYKSTIMQL